MSNGNGLKVAKRAFLYLQPSKPLFKRVDYYCHKNNRFQTEPILTGYPNNPFYDLYFHVLMS